MLAISYISAMQWKTVSITEFAVNSNKQMAIYDFSEFIITIYEYT